MKHPPMDLSRFAKCTIKKPAICDLLMVDEFRRAVGEFDGEITDEWMLVVVEGLYRETSTSEDLAIKMLEDGFIIELENRKQKHELLRNKAKLLRQVVQHNGETQKELP